MDRSRIAGLTIAIAGIAFSVVTTAGEWLSLGQPWFSREPTDTTTLADMLPQLSTTGLLMFACAALIVLLFSRTVPRWWSLAYALFVLAAITVVMWREGEAAVEFIGQYRRDPDVLFSGWQPRLVDYVVLVLRLLLGVVASLAMAAPLVLPQRFARRPPDVPPKPLGL